MTDSQLVYISNSTGSGTVEQVGYHNHLDPTRHGRHVFFVKENLLGTTPRELTFDAPNADLLFAIDNLDALYKPEDIPENLKVLRMVHDLSKFVSKPYAGSIPNPRAIRFARSVEPGYATAIILCLAYGLLKPGFAFQTIARRLYPSAPWGAGVEVGDTARTMCPATDGELKAADEYFASGYHLLRC